MKERWKYIKETDNCYLVSSLGRIRGIKRDLGYRTHYPGLLSLKHKRNGYIVVFVHINKKRIILSVHRMVAKYFIPNPENKPQVNHKNGIRDDNRFENLEWATPLENTRHAIHVLNKPSSLIEWHRQGNRNSTYVLTDEDVKSIKQMYCDGRSQADIARNFQKVKKECIWKIVHNYSWTRIPWPEGCKQKKRTKLMHF